MCKIKINPDLDLSPTNVRKFESFAAPLFEGRDRIRYCHEGEYRDKATVINMSIKVKSALPSM